MAITAAQRLDIIKATVSVFGIAPAGYMTALTSIYEAVGGNLTAFTTALTNTAAYQSASFYPSYLTNAEVATKMAAAFALSDTTTPAGQAAYDYFLANLNAGASAGSLFAAAQQFLDTTTDTAFATAKATLANKAAVAEYYTVTQAATGTDLGVLASVVSGVTSTTDVSTAAAMAAVISTTAGAASGQTFTLTTGADNITGTANNDTFSGLSQATAAAATDTLTAADIIDGGAGIDTLNITTTAANTDVTDGAQITNIEVVNIRAATAGTTSTLDASSIAGLTGVNANAGAGAVTVTNLATGASMTVTGNGTVTNGAITFGYATGTDAVTLNVAGGTKVGTTVSNTGTATTATINSTGAANILGTVDIANATLTSVTINATTNLKADLLSQATDQVGTDGAVTISGAATTVELTAALDNTIKTIDASGLTAGGVKATLGTGTEDYKGGAGVDTITLAAGVKTATFGAGNDVVTTTSNAGLAGTAAGVVNGGEGTDTLVVAHANDVDTSAERAVFTSFETLNNATTGAIAADGFTGVTSLISSGIQGGFTAMNATQAAAITNTAVQAGGTTYALTTATGTSDVLSIETKHATATTAADLAALTVNGFETMNVTVSSGNVDETNAEATVVSFAAATDLTSLNIAGAFAANVILDNTSKAVTVANTLSGTAAMKVEGELIKGSSVTTTANGDTIETALAAIAGVQGEFVSYNAGAGDDAISTSLTAINNTNNALASLKIEGGEGTDTLSFDTADATFADAQFQYVTGVEKVTLTNITSLSVTSGGFFDNNFKASGVTLTTGTTANGATQTIDLSSFTGAATIVATTAGDGASTADNSSITTGSGADTVTLTATSWVGAAGAAGAINVVTGGGNDTISVTTGTLLAVTGTNAVTINAGTGADTITAVHDNAGSGLGNFTFVIADGDSLAASRDKITGFDLGTAAKFADTLDLNGTPTVTANTAGTNGTDSGSIKSHAITSGIITFDDVDTFATALTVNESNLSTVLTYLATNITTAGDTVAFAYDSNSDGTTDATIVFQQGTNDTVVELVGVVATSISATNATTAGLIDLA
ncbi:beta strand repeat-containing protein [Thiosulfativibrio zosterae]|uniref:S-layer protein n=1 Tax=Thiosulfativibrio zosterae TaxID=2675053 RepID=A0A6F8PQN4_9GAMM|nr:hypothetical protein [Thiosulfativibrio zosterae]BBP44300.1 hypothetical protein THMIRHAT_20460 [Thiosulfativibrio zosterae]